MSTDSQKDNKKEARITGLQKITAERTGFTKAYVSMVCAGKCANAEITKTYNELKEKFIEALS